MLNMCASWKEGKMLAQWVCAEKSMFALYAVAVSESVFIIRSDGMLSLCVHAADGRWDLLSPPEQLRLAHHAPCTSLDACGLPHVFITKGASRAASHCNGCLKMHLLKCMHLCFIVYVVYVGAAWFVASRSTYVHTEELDVLKGRRLCASACLCHICMCLHVCSSSDEAHDGIKLKGFFQFLDRAGTENIAHASLASSFLFGPVLYLCANQAFGIVCKILKIDWRAY